MRRSRPRRTILRRLLPRILGGLLLLGLFVALGGCANLGSGNTETTAPPETGSTPTADAAQGGAGRISAENILFRDDFQDGDADGWQVGGAWVVQQDGDLYTFDATGEGYAFVPAGVGWQGDYAFKTSYLLSAGTLGFSFDATQEGRYYVSIGNDLISLVKEDAAGARTVLTQAQAPAGGKQHYLTMAKKDGTIQVYVDRALWLAYQDAAPLTAGTIMVGALDGTTAWVDDVLVNKILRALPAGTPAVAAIDPSQVVAPPQDESNLDELLELDEDIELDEDNLLDDIPTPTVSFIAWEDGDRPVPGVHELTVAPGTRVIMEWQVTDASAVYLNQTPQPLSGTANATIQEGFNYELEVIGLDGLPYSYYVNITVTDDDRADETDLVITCTVTDLGDTDVAVHVQVRNTGSADAQALKLRWYAHEQSGVVDEQTGCTILAGGSFSIDWIFRYDAHGTMHWMATIDEEENMPDPNRANNRVTGAVQVAD